MAAVRSVNAGNYIAAAKAASNNFVDTYGAVLDNSPDYGNIARKGLIENTKTHIEAMKADKRVAEAGIKKERDLRIAKYKLDSANSIWKAQESTRKAGKLAAASENLYEAFKKQRDPYIQDYSKLDAYYDEQQAKIDARKAKVNDPNNTFGLPEPIPVPLPQPLPTYTPPNPSNNPSATSSASKPTYNIPSTVPSITNRSLSRTSTASSLNLLPGLAAIRRVESDAFGAYEAYNLGGRTEFEPIGSGNSSDGRQFGKPLTKMKIGELKQLGAQGKIHASGAYQFTHNTGSFNEAAAFAGLSDNDYFTPENQDKMALAFGQKYGWERWSGLKRLGNEQERAEAIAGFQ